MCYPSKFEIKEYTYNSLRFTRNLNPMESIRFPVEACARIMFTGYYNGFSVEVRAFDEVALLYHMGCFGKGSLSRSKPKYNQNQGSAVIIRKRQFLKRNYWYKKFGGQKNNMDDKQFFKEVDELNTILKSNKKQNGKDVIDLVSSDEDISDQSETPPVSENEIHNNEDIVVIVPNSDSEEENYFYNLKPKCCINKTRVFEKLILTLQEAFFLMFGLGCLRIVNDNKLLNIQQCWNLFTKIDRNFINKYVVYQYYRSKGYVVKPSIKFSGDYLLYREGPGLNHADYIVIIKNDLACNWTSVLGQVRMATTTVKEIIMVEVESGNSDKPLPEGLSDYTVREIVINRKVPDTINGEE